MTERAWWTSNSKGIDGKSLNGEWPPLINKDERDPVLDKKLSERLKTRTLQLNKNNGRREPLDNKYKIFIYALSPKREFFE